MKVLVTGANGLLGQYVSQQLAAPKTDLLLTGLEEKIFSNRFDDVYATLDLTRYEELKRILQSFRPDYVVNCAAFTNVDACETLKEVSWKINVKAVEALSRLSRLFHFHLIHISTDYIFDGMNGPYCENDKPNPISFYGKEKLAAENEVISNAESFTILRTNVLYGVNKLGKHNFVTWLMNELLNQRPVKIVGDQFNNATFAGDLSQAIAKILERGIQGVYHIGGLEYMDRHSLAQKIGKLCHLNDELIKKISTVELKQAAQRPLKGGLKIDKAIKDLQFAPTPLNSTIKEIWKDLKQENEG